jgi:hypothetical protein
MYNDLWPAPYHCGSQPRPSVQRSSLSKARVDSGYRLHIIISNISRGEILWNFRQEMHIGAKNRVQVQEKDLARDSTLHQMCIASDPMPATSRGWKILGHKRIDTSVYFGTA